MGLLDLLKDFIVPQKEGKPQRKVRKFKSTSSKAAAKIKPKPGGKIIKKKPAEKAPKKKPVKKKPIKKIANKPPKKKAKKLVKKKAKKTVKKKLKLPGKLPKKKPKKLPKKPKFKPRQIGVITHYFAKILVGVIKLKSPLAVGEVIHIKGDKTDFVQIITSMQINRRDVSRGAKGEVGIKVIEPVRPNDKVYKA